ncbi:MAG: glycosyltransferase [archaeon]
MKKLKVAYLALGEKINAPIPAFTHTRGICQALSKQADLTLFIGSGEKGETNVEGVKTVIVETPTLKNLSKIFSFKSKELKKQLNDFDVVQERFHVNPLTLLLGQGNKTFLEVNDPGIEVHKGLKGFAFKPLIKRKFDSVKAIITQTETLKKIISKHTKTPVFVVSNGVNIERFNNKINGNNKRKQLGLKQDETLIVFSGAFREWHGVQDIPLIAEKLKKEKVKFLLLGNGLLFNEVKEIVKENGLQEKVILFGSVSQDELPEFLAAADIFIAPFNVSRYPMLEKHGFWWSPMKLFEFLAMGKPIVSYDFNEVKKIVGNAGILAENSNLDDFVIKLEKLIKDKKLRLSLGLNAEKKAVNEFSWNKKALETIKVYDKIFKIGEIK